MSNIPVLLITFNRPDATRQTLDAIRHVRPRQLFVAADGPRHNKPNAAGPHGRWLGRSIGPARFRRCFVAKTVRNTPGGLMANYLERTVLINGTYVLGRIGYVGRLIRDELVNEKSNTAPQAASGILSDYARKILRNMNHKKMRQRCLNVLLTREERICLQVGRFRQAGEIHYWMHDRFSLSKLLMHLGFKSPSDSDVPDWGKYELDVKNQCVYDPTSLFIEAYKS